MYLTKLFRHNKWLFSLILGFSIIQLFINFKRGLTVTPFLHYGMYSGKFNVPDSIDIWQFEVNNRQINLAIYNARIVDHIVEPVNTYATLNHKGISLYNKTI